MVTLYKLTDSAGKTFNDTQWGPGVTHSGTGHGGLCGPGYIHAYEHPLLAAFLHPLHVNFSGPKLWLCEADSIAERQGQLKCGAVRLTTIREIEFVVPSAAQMAAFAILCALRVYKEPGYLRWAEMWLDNTDRSADRAKEAGQAVMYAATYAAGAAHAAAYAARAAANAMYASIYATEAAAYATAYPREFNIDLVAIAEQAMSF